MGGRWLRILLLVCVVGAISGQLTFTPTWGKRGLGGGGNSGPASPSAQDQPCKASIDALMLIYKLIQSEAQKLIECEK